MKYRKQSCEMTNLYTHPYYHPDVAQLSVMQSAVLFNVQLAAISLNSSFKVCSLCFNLIVCGRLQLSSGQKRTHRIRLHSKFISPSLGSSVLKPPLFLHSQVTSFLIEISGAASGEDVKVAKVCSLVGMSHTHTRKI